MRGRFLRLAMTASLLAAVFLPCRARADVLSFSSIFFQPATGRNPYLMLHGTQTLHGLQFDVGDFFSYGYRPLKMESNGVTQSVIEHLLVSDLVMAFGATEWMQLGLDFPVVLVNTFRSPFVDASSPASNYVNMGDLRFELKARVLDPCRTHIGLAFIPFVTAPTGYDQHYVGDPGLTGGVKIALDGRINDRLGLTFNVGYQGGRKVKIENVEFQHRLLLGLGIQGTVKPGFDIVGEVNAVAAMNELFQSRDSNAAEIMAGARWDVEETGVTIQGGAGTCITCGVKGARVRAVVGARYRWNPEKYRTMDREAGKLCAMAAGFTMAQLAALQQHCPPHAEDFQRGVHDDACPKYYELREVAGLMLRCPSRPEDFDEKVHDASCPKVFNLSETYTPEEIKNIRAMSIYELSLACPSDPAKFNAQINDAACPKYYDLKEAEELSRKCPARQEDYREGVDDVSCPKFYELRDTYGSVDWSQVDLFEGTEMAKGGAAIRGGEIQTLEPVYFAFNDAVLRADAARALDQVIGVINAAPWVDSVRVGGHADARGTPQANELISRERAQTVIEYMRAHGLRSGVQLTPVAYGSYRPAAPNTTEEGRAMNRRVVFTVSSAGVAPASPRVPPSSGQQVTPPTPVPQAAPEPVAQPEPAPAAAAPVPVQVPEAEALPPVATPAPEKPLAPPTRWGQ
jgi:outer membrane protein OmpA-like peptidoglycan-associated protein